MENIQPQLVPAGAQIIDVREEFEYAEEHAAGVTHIPMAQIPARLDEIDVDRDIYLICRSGGRSAQVGQYLEQALGWDVINIEGGTQAWKAAGLAMEQG